MKPANISRKGRGEKEKKITKTLCYSVVIILLLGCAKPPKVPPSQQEQSVMEQIEVTPEEDAYEAVPVKAEPVFAMSAESARPGESVTVGYLDESGASLQAVLIDYKGRRISKAAFFTLDSGLKIKAAILGIPSTAAIGEALIRVEQGGEMILELPFTIEDRDFDSETIPLNQQNTEIRTVPDPQKTAESELLWAIISRTGTEIYSEGLFILPLSTNRRTSSYGSRRIYEYSDGKTDTTIHAGVDIGVPTGTNVLACAAGKVVLARSRIITGNTVVLEHLPGVYSLYYHMDSIAVSEGSVVQAGAVLGESGSTGLATGPHLHWEVRVSTENADPDVFLTRPVLDKNDIINKMLHTTH